MQGRVGPILTTGATLCFAAVVVANPVIAPRADLKIPAVHLSADRHDDLAMLDAAFVNAIAPASTELASSPLSVWRDLVSSLSADASYLGRTAVAAVLFGGVTAVSETDLTAVSYPYLAAAPAVSGGYGIRPEAGAFILPSGSGATVVPADPSLAGPVSAAVAQSLVDVVETAGALSDSTLKAAVVAASTWGTAQGSTDLENFSSLVDRNVRSVLQGLVDAVSAPQPVPAVPGGILNPGPAVPGPASGSWSDPSTSGLLTSVPGQDLRNPDSVPAPDQSGGNLVAPGPSAGGPADTGLPEPVRHPRSRPPDGVATSMRDQIRRTLSDARDTVDRAEAAQPGAGAD